MIGTSLSDYILIRLCIVFLHLIAPLSVICSLAMWLFRLPLRFPRVVQVWFILEALFYIAVYLPRRHYLQRAAKHPNLVCREDRQKLCLRCHSNIPDTVQYLRKWFRGAEEADIKCENVKDFYRWAFLNTSEPDPAHDEELEEYIGEMEKLLGRKLEPGRGSAKCFTLTLDKVEMLHRSLTWYLCVLVIDTTASIRLHINSFNFYRTPFPRFLAIFPFRPLSLLATNYSPGRNLTYWHRPHTCKIRLPILFIHGIGVGLYPYIDFLANLNADNGDNSSDGQVGIIAIEIMSVSSRMVAEAIAKADMCEDIYRILRAHGWERFVLVSHSYGSVVAAYLFRAPQIAQRIGPVVFIDPVSFLLHLPDVAYNFIHRKPTHANEHLLSYFGSKDMGVSHTLFRRFFWAENILWREDIQNRRAAVILGGRDIVINSKAIWAYLMGAEVEKTKDVDSAASIWKKKKLDVLWFENLEHGQVFRDKGTRSKLVQTVMMFCRQ